MRSAVRVIAAGARGQDRGAVLDFGLGTLIVVADGAGGTAGGAEAAQFVIDRVSALPRHTEHDWAQLLRQLDLELSQQPTAGETTAVLALSTPDSIVGASIGDSSAWMLVAGTWLDLLQNPHRKPLLGSGRAIAVPFGPHPIGPRILAGSDGLFKYVPFDRIATLAELHSLDRAAEELVQAARLPGGSLQDDITVVIADPMHLASSHAP